MDLIGTLRTKIDVLDDGDYVSGLKAVLLHIETAFRHLSRGQESGDDTAFTDAIYRTNQAFEGSIKEAYRVLAGHDPSKIKPFDIENYLEQNNIFRSRVLNQFTIYRQEWRNPSTHDYKLDFDESEAFLAIVSVTAFACLLLDQITERLSFLKSKAEAEANKQILDVHFAGTKSKDLLARTTDALQQFCASNMLSMSSVPYTEQLIGTLHGFLVSVFPDFIVDTEQSLSPDRPFRADIVISSANEKVIVEIKRHTLKKNYQNARAQVEHYMLISGIKNGVLLFMPAVPSQLELKEIYVGGIDGRLAVLIPKES